MLRKKIFKILSVLVAVIIAFSCLIVPLSAATIREDTYLDYLKFNSLTMYVLLYDSSGSLTSSTLLNVKPVGISGDGSLKLDCSVSNSSIIIPNGCTVQLGLSWSSSSSGSYYISFPDSFVGVYRNSGNGATKISDFLFKVNSPLNASNNLVVFKFTPNVAFTRFYLNLSLDDPTEVSPIKVLFNDLNNFFDFSLVNLSDVFRITKTNGPLLVLIFGFVSVGFVFGILYRVVKR